jgi:hypothetical protein
MSITNFLGHNSVIVVVFFFHGFVLSKHRCYLSKTRMKHV